MTPLGSPYGMDDPRGQASAAAGMLPDTMPTVDDYMAANQQYFNELPPTQPANLSYLDRLALALSNMQPLGPRPPHTRGIDSVLRFAAGLAQGYGAGRAPAIQRQQAAVQQQNELGREKAKGNLDARMKDLENKRQVVIERIRHQMSGSAEARMPVTAEEAAIEPALARWVGKNLTPGERSSIISNDPGAIRRASSARAQGTSEGAPEIKMSPESKRAWAIYSVKQGRPVRFGFGKNGTQLSAEIADLGPKLMKGVDIYSTAAKAAANKKALSERTNMLSAVRSWESTALKNINQAAELAKKIPDVNAPWLNQPIRKVNKGALGSADQAAFNAALYVAGTEFAKVLNGATGNAALTDAARNEVKNELLDPNLSYRGLLKVIKTLRTDSRNRRKALEEEIDLLGRQLEFDNAPNKPPDESLIDEKDLVPE